MVFGNQRTRQLRDAKVFGAQIAQLKKPFVLLMNDIPVAGDDTGQDLVKFIQEGHPAGEALTWFDPAGYDRYYHASKHDVSHGAFQGTLWLFENVSEYHKTVEDLENRMRHLESDHRMFSEARTNLEIPVWITGENNQLYYHNTAYNEMFGATLPASIREVVRENVRSTTGNISVVPAILQGNRRQLEVHVKPLTHGRMLIWAIDRTEELESMAGRDRLIAAQRGLFEQLHTAVALYDQSANLIFYNSAFSRMWGLDEAYLNTKPHMGDVIDRLRLMRRLPEQADFKSYKNSWLRLVTELMSPQEDMLYLPDGHTVRVLTVPNPAGGLFFTFEDVTTTLELESSLNTVLAVQRETLDHMTEAIAVYGGDGRLKLWNPQYAKMWNLYPEVLATTPHISAIVEAKSRVFSKEKREAMKKKLMSQALERHEVKGRFEMKDGRHVNYMAIPLPDGATLLAYDDVTAAHNVERALRERTEALEAAERLKLDFLANVSYQLRTPLNAIIGFAELLEHQYFGTLNQKQIDYAKGITDAGQRLLSLVDDILDLATIEAGYMQIIRDRIDVAEMVQGVYRLTEEWARKSQHKYTLNLAKNLQPFYGDERRLKQVLLNLIRNAIAFTPRGGKIEIGAFQDETHLRLWVQDNGLGISTEDQDRVFKAFERIEDSEASRRASGAGLGLSLVQSIIHLHEGTVELDSGTGKGTKITLVFPLEGR